MVVVMDGTFLLAIMCSSRTLGCTGSREAYVDVDVEVEVDVDACSQIE